MPHNEALTTTLEQLRERYRRELFDEQLPFWDRFGIDHELGGFCCALDYDGSRVNDEKFVWFQGRGLWVYSFLYNHLKRDPAYLEVARKTKDFLLAHAPQPDGRWASNLSREGRTLAPETDLYGRYFAIEGLYEYSQAADDEQARDTALAMFKDLFRREMAQDAVGPLTQGFWMVNINIARQILDRETDAEVAAIADQSINAVIQKHFNPDYGLNNENLNRDFTRSAEEATKCNLGHSIETLWMVMQEARRRGDAGLQGICAGRIQHHLNVGWDWLYGGLAMWINVDQGGYEWPLESVPGTNLQFRSVGEYNYTKSLWAVDEVLIACLLILEQRNAPWAERFLVEAQKVMDEKFSMQQSEGPPTYVLFSDRRITRPPRSVRQDNYHRLRALTMNLLTLERLVASGPSIGGE
ncbi:MAG: AGE family epimerase/isomerase [Acidobacteria bacterium]|nr:AGE family epimerase/isomerase [Acidobacteriota bacterium]